jgi:hypothetical protein
VGIVLLLVFYVLAKLFNTKKIILMISASELSIIFASFFIGWIPGMIGFNFFDTEHGIYIYVFAICTVYIVTGQIICDMKDLGPEWSEKIKNNKVDVWWGLSCYYYYLFWPTYL